jgi:antibiotic biosynthesis monooxygenase (ABM) superfamily enzyme
MIARIWHGWTTRENAAAYEKLLREEVLIDLARRNIRGYKGGEIFVREEGDEVEVITLLRFECLEGVKVFAGEDYEKPVINPDARKLLTRFSECSKHYRIVPLD